MKIEIFGNTDLGQIRTNNEDAYIIRQIWDEDHILAVVIDGVGGQEGGEVAAEIAKNTIESYLKSFPNGERLTLLRQAVTEANNEIFKNREIQPQYPNMSCVLTACLIEKSRMRLNMVHVGDTRLYKYAENKLEKLSHDHSLIGYREEIGDLTEEEAMNHPQRNIIGRDVGSALHKVDDDDFLEGATFPFDFGTTFLLCSDGLCDMLTSSEITSVLAGKGTAETKVNDLIAGANKKGGKDNITVVIVDFQGKAQKKKEILVDEVPSQTKEIQFEEVSPRPSRKKYNADQGEFNYESPEKKSNLLRNIASIIIVLALGFLAGFFVNKFFVQTGDVQDSNDPAITNVSVSESLSAIKAYDIFEIENLNYKEIDSLGIQMADSLNYVGIENLNYSIGQELVKKDKASIFHPNDKISLIVITTDSIIIKQPENKGLAIFKKLE